MIQIRASQITLNPAGDTIWVHSRKGSVLLRIKTKGRFIIRDCDTSPFSHADIIVEDDIHLCLARDAKGERF